MLNQLRIFVGTLVLALLLPISAGAANALSCEPYKCADGMRVERCGTDGTPIAYFAEPCHQHGGQAETLPESFADVPSSHPNADAIAFTKSQGIVGGYPDGTFRPDQVINRAEFVKILVKTQQTPNPDFHCEFRKQFTDIDPNAWYGEYLCLAIWDPDSWIEGYPDGTFRPAQPINFVEAAKLFDRAFDFTGSEGSAWYEAYVRTLEERNAIPVSIKKFDQLITRGEMAEIMYRLKANIKTKPSTTYDELAR